MDRKPIRVQLSRKKGWRKPENTVSVARPGRFGNPFRIGDLKCFINSETHEKVLAQPKDAAEAVAWFRWLADRSHPSIFDELRGKNLACWCPLDQPCHADVLLELANQPTQPKDGNDE